MERSQLFSIVGFICWSIWKARCSFVYEGKPLSPGDSIASALCSINEFLNAQVPPTISPTHTGNLSWTPPPPELVKINCDAAWDKATCKAGLGVIVRNYLGHCIGGLAKPATCGSALIAESEAILEGVTFARNLQLRKVIITTDSLEVINNIKNPITHGCWKLWPILRSIRRIAACIDVVLWEWSPREANKVAHAAAALATRVVCLNRWASVPPPSLSLVLRNDGLPCPH